MEYARYRLKQKEYKERLLNSNIKDAQIKGMERTSRRKIGQI